MTASRTPWHLSVGLNAGYIGSNSDGFVRIRTPFLANAFPPDDEESLANARLIVTAVNSHAALVDALRRLTDACGDMVQALDPDSDLEPIPFPEYDTALALLAALATPSEVTP